MPLDITFTLSDQDLEHFQQIVDKARAAMDSDRNAAQIEAAARQLIEDATSTELPDFIADRLAKLQVVINMLTDAEWNLGEEDRNRVLGALLYFCDPEDLIPDHIPGLGFLDDAIYVELVLQELRAEITSYEEFCAYRIAEENRRRAQGLDPHVEREAWLADKRATLHARMRKRRRSGASSGGWRLRW
ncbi:MAG: YkvA family protein [Gammaproteobacteria bacterium]|nr:YkvA family protein [Gammaproteobacteria bacterium]MDH5309258.1 YkvA family protein [Gammaproteobacteria bacterium]